MLDTLIADVLRQAIGTIFGILSTLVLATIGAAFKTYFDVRKQKYQLNQAFKKIRDLEERINASDITRTCDQGAIDGQSSRRS